LFQLKVAHNVLDDKMAGVTARSTKYPESEHQEAVEYVTE
jgi:hypothetical protein